MRVTVNQRTPVSRPRAYCEECAKKPFSGHVNPVDINNRTDWEEVVELFRDDLCVHLEALVDLPSDDTLAYIESLHELLHEHIDSGLSMTLKDLPLVPGLVKAALALRAKP